MLPENHLVTISVTLTFTTTVSPKTLEQIFDIWAYQMECINKILSSKYQERGMCRHVNASKRPLSSYLMSFDVGRDLSELLWRVCAWFYLLLTCHIVFSHYCVFVFAFFHICFLLTLLCCRGLLSAVCWPLPALSFHICLPHSLVASITASLLNYFIWCALSWWLLAVCQLTCMAEYLLKCCRDCRRLACLIACLCVCIFTHLFAYLLNCFYYTYSSLDCRLLCWPHQKLLDIWRSASMCLTVCTCVVNLVLQRCSLDGPMICQ